MESFKKLTKALKKDKVLKFEEYKQIVNECMEECTPPDAFKIFEVSKTFEVFTLIKYYIYKEMHELIINARKKKGEIDK